MTLRLAAAGVGIISRLPGKPRGPARNRRGGVELARGRRLRRPTLPFVERGCSEVGGIGGGPARSEQTTLILIQETPPLSQASARTVRKR
jgi:hypothetical protein